MTGQQAAGGGAVRLKDAARPAPSKILNPESLALYDGVATGAPVLVILAAGKGTRFGKDPKCIQAVSGMPLARHSIDAFRRVSPSPVVCLVGYRHAEVAAATQGRRWRARTGRQQHHDRGQHDAP